MRNLHVLDVDGDGKAEVCYSYGNSICIRSRMGEVIKRHPIQDVGYIGGLDLVRYPDLDGPLCFLVAFTVEDDVTGELVDRQRILSLDLETHVADINRDLEDPDVRKVVPRDAVELAAAGRLFYATIGSLKHQAAWAGFSATRLVLSIYGSDNVLEYREILASSEGEIAKGDGAIFGLENDLLLVAYGPDLWSYRIKPYRIK